MLVAVLSGAFLTFAIDVGKYVLAALLNRPAFGPYMVWMGSNRADEPAALAVIAFAITWDCLGLIQLVARLAPISERDPDAIHQLNGLAKQFGSNRVVDGFSLSISKGAFVSLLGPSVCGRRVIEALSAQKDQRTVFRNFFGKAEYVVKATGPGGGRGNTSNDLFSGVYSN